MLSPDHARFLLNIPKNASSYLSSWSMALGWSATSCENLPADVQEMCVILRDPVDRWISGMAQYVNGYILHVQGHDVYRGVVYQYVPAAAFIQSYNMIVERLIFDQINRFDDHVWPQSELCADICVGMPRRYIMMDQQFDQHVSQYFDADPVPDLYRNSGADNPDQQALQEFLRDRLVKRPELRERVIKAYASDYDFIERAMNEMV